MKEDNYVLGVGDSYKEVIVANEQIIEKIAEVSGDRNPIHLDENYARQSKFKKRIAHALFCINGISMIIGNSFPGEGAILLSQKFQYLRPVYIDDEIEISVEVSGILPRDKYVLQTVCRNQLGEIVLEGESVIKWENNTEGR